MHLTLAKKEKLLKKLDGLLLDDLRKPRVIQYYEDNDTFLPHLIKALEIEENTRLDRINQVDKATRAGYTTNSVLAGLLLDNKLIIAEPTNAIAINTINKAIDIYLEITDDHSIMFRIIPSNALGCKKYKKSDYYVPQLTNCKDCDATVYEPKEGEPQYPVRLDFNADYCYIKTMMQEAEEFKKRGEVYAPNILACTFDKLRTLHFKGIKNKFYRELISNMDSILWDEYSKFLQKTYRAGMICEESKYKGEVLNYTDIQKKYAEIRNYTIKNRRDINTVDGMHDDSTQDTVADSILSFLDTFIKPIVNYYDTLLGCTQPSNHTNPLRMENLPLKSTYRENSEPKSIPKNEELQMNMGDYSEAISYLNVHKQGQEYVEYLHDLMLVLMEEDIVMQEDTGKSFKHLDKSDPKNPKRIKIIPKRKSITISNRGILEFFGRFGVEYPKLTQVISDATPSDVNLDDINRKIGESGTGKKHVKLYYGDPAKTSKKQTIFQYKPLDKPKEVYNFSSFKWGHDNKDNKKNNKVGHDEFYLGILDDLILNDRIDISDTFLIVPNMDIYFDLLKHYEDIAVGTDATEEEQVGKLIITYYNSSMSMGVESDRRTCIALGVATKPLGAYKSTILGQGDFYKHFSDDMLTEFAEKQEMSLEDFKKRIDIFSNTTVLPNGEQLPQPKTIPIELKEWFEEQARAQREIVIIQDTKQGIDRSKDPKGTAPSKIITVGVRDKEVNKIRYFGTEHNYKNDRNVTREYQIEPPKVYQIIDLDEIDTCHDMESHSIGYDDDFSKTLFNDLFFGDKKVINLEELMINYKRNTFGQEYTEDHLKAFLVGTVNLLRKEMEGRCIEVKRSGNKHSSKYEFSVKKDWSGYKIIEHTSIELNAKKILKSALNTKGDRYSMENLLQNHKYISKEEFIEAMDFMDEEGILNGCIWEIVEGKGYNLESIENQENVKKIGKLIAKRRAS